MITKEQALKLQHGDILHVGECTKTIGPRGGVQFKPECWRVNGKVKTWKTRSTHFRVPLKYGLYDYGYLDQDNAHYFHLESECNPTAIDKQKGK